MKNKIDKNQEEITRKDAALTALGSYLILNPQKAQAQSPETPGNNF